MHAILPVDEGHFLCSEHLCSASIERMVFTSSVQQWFEILLQAPYIELALPRSRFGSSKRVMRVFVERFRLLARL